MSKGLIFNLTCVIIAGSFFASNFKSCNAVPVDQPMVHSTRIGTWKQNIVDNQPDGSIPYLQPIPYEVPQLKPRWAGIDNL